MWSRVAIGLSNQGNAEPMAAKNETASESGPKCRGNGTDDEVVKGLTESEFEDQQFTARNEIEKLGTVSQELGYVIIDKQVRMTRKYQNHTLQTNPRHSGLLHCAIPQTP